MSQVREHGRPPRVIAHLDMDAFFASVEVLDDPALAHKPVVVGGTGERAVVASASYEARRYGIRSAMPMARARQLCRDLVIVPGHFDRYGALSAQLMAILRDTTPLVEPVALDEAFLDLTSTRASSIPPVDAMAAVRERVLRELELSCSVGIGSSKLIAKLASKAAKPLVGAPSGNEPGGQGAGVLLVDGPSELAFLWGQPVRALPGVGPKTAEKLARFSVATVGDLALVPKASLQRSLGVHHGGALFDLSHGLDERPVEPERELKSIGHEETFALDVHELEPLQSVALEMAGDVAARCRANKVRARRVSVKVRFGDFSTITRSASMLEALQSGAAIGAVAQDLLGQVDVGSGVRLLGVSVSVLEPDDEPTPGRQLSLFEQSAGSVHAPGVAPGEEDLRARHEEAELAADQVRRRYGARAIGSLAALARRRTPPREEQRER